MTHFPRLFEPLLNLHLVDSWPHRFLLLAQRFLLETKRGEKLYFIPSKEEDSSPSNRSNHSPKRNGTTTSTPFLSLSLLSFRYTRPLSPTHVAHSPFANPSNHSHASITRRTVFVAPRSRKIKTVTTTDHPPLLSTTIPSSYCYPDIFDLQCEITPRRRPSSVRLFRDRSGSAYAPFFSSDPSGEFSRAPPLCTTTGGGHDRGRQRTTWCVARCVVCVVRFV